MVNGIGTWFCTAHVDAGWGWDDAVECAMFVYLPVWPIRVCHLRLEPGGSFAPENYQAIPLRWSDQLVRQVFLRCWFGGCIGLGALCLALLGLHALSPPTGKSYVVREWTVLQPILVPLAPCLIVGGIVGQVLMGNSGRRQQDIRLLLGLHRLGSSDPSMWPDNELEAFNFTQSVFGTSTYADAVPQLLQAEAWTGAMWAARLTTARENRTAGDALTADVLAHPGTQKALQSYKLGAASWRDSMGVAQLQQYQAQHSIVDAQVLFQLALMEQVTQQKRIQASDEFVAGVAAIGALIGLGLAAWLGSMVNIQVALLAGVVGSVVGAIAGALLCNAIVSRR